MAYSFDEVFERQGTDCVKWEFVKVDSRYEYSDLADPARGADRLLPMWVADMDFRCPPAVIEALKSRALHGVFGYCAPTATYFEALIDWNAGRYGRQIKQEWITLTPGVVPALKAMVQSFVAPGEKVLVQRPVYYPFFDAVEQNGGEIVSNSLIYQAGRYEMDFEDLANKAADPALKMAILCSPHNPVGRVWTEEELTRFGQICLDNNVLVVSDEVHCDLIYSWSKFTTFANISERFAQNSIICTAPSKTFNLAGLKTSNIIIQNRELQKKFNRTVKRDGLEDANVFGLTATEAAYRHGGDWLAAVMAYVEENYVYMADYIAQNLPQVSVIRPEGTYLVWVDFSGLGLDPATRKTILMEQAKVYLDEGNWFGPEGADFERFNIACPRSILVEALDRITQVINSEV